ncbi:Clp1/GlmU family protein [Geotalea uraniireducens]|uniref:Clp1/GlmU family protein n=1 Tax=Geotalea uraniireducens TaxID=351604 RepID=UPI0012EDF124|nr:polynucleotide 5'-hydroxyl-kinase [Geotalea uraniireducens]
MTRTRETICMESTTGPGWEDLLETLRRERGVILLLGATDSGKSTLARFLVAGLTATGLTVALVDTDVGQSALCLPGTVGVKLFRSSADLADYRCEQFSFLGSANPARLVPRLLETTGRLTELARSRAEVVLIDTTGLISGELGRGLKLAKIRVTLPDQIIALQRRDECEPILGQLDELVIRRIHPHPAARTRSKESRSRIRRERLAAYFANATPAEMLLHGDEVELYRLGERVSLRHEQLAAGTVIGLNHGDETLGLGLVMEADREGITFRSPLGSLAGVKRVVFGDVAL